jgi:hypothetical protein
LLWLLSSSWSCSLHDTCNCLWIIYNEIVDVVIVYNIRYVLSFLSVWRSRALTCVLYSWISYSYCSTFHLIFVLDWIILENKIVASFNEGYFFIVLAYTRFWRWWSLLSNWPFISNLASLSINIFHDNITFNFVIILLNICFNFLVFHITNLSICSCSRIVIILFIKHIRCCLLTLLHCRLWRILFSNLI